MFCFLGTKLLVDKKTPHEMRVVSLSRKENNIVISESMQGATTEAIFGTNFHVHQICLTDSALKQLQDILPYAEKEGFQALSLAFSEGIFEWLSDIQDVLDRHKIEYSYVCSTCA